MAGDQHEPIVAEKGPMLRDGQDKHFHQARRGPLVRGSNFDVGMSFFCKEAWFKTTKEKTPTTFKEGQGVHSRKGRRVAKQACSAKGAQAEETAQARQRAPHMIAGEV